MVTPGWKKISIIVAACLLIIAGIWTGVILNLPKETMIMSSVDDWTGTEATTPPAVDVTPPDKIETATFALG